MIPQTDILTPGRRVSKLSLSSSREGDPGGGSTGKRPAKKAAKKAAKKPAKKGK
jgi:hypothetical protein